MAEDTIFLSIPNSIIEESNTERSLSKYKEVVNVVLAADAGYFYPMLCVIKSACANKLSSTVYQFILLVDDDFSKEKSVLVNSVLKKYGLPSAKIHNRSKEYLDVEYKAEHLSRAACYRLQIPTLLNELEKCIYLDCDTLIRHDLSEFCRMLKKDDLIVGVYAAAYQLDPEKAKAKADLLGLPNIDTYINSGVMVMNLKLMRDIGIEDIFDDMLERDFPDIDQDILNAACYGRVRIAPPQYNAMTKYSFDEDAFEADPSIRICWTFDEWEKARIDPSIVHFADTDKPWTDYALPFAKEWWGYIEDMGLIKDVFDFFYDLHASRQSSVYEMRRRVVAAEADLWTANDTLEKERRRNAAKIDELNQRIDRLKDRVSRQKSRIALLKEKLSLQRQKTVEVKNSLKSARASLSALKSSRSYKLGRAITKPYRSIKGKKE